MNYDLKLLNKHNETIIMKCGGDNNTIIKQNIK